MMVDDKKKSLRKLMASTDPPVLSTCAPRRNSSLRKVTSIKPSRLEAPLQNLLDTPANRTRGSFHRLASNFPQETLAQNLLDSPIIHTRGSLGAKSPLQNLPHEAPNDNLLDSPATRVRGALPRMSSVQGSLEHQIPSQNDFNEFMRTTRRSLHSLVQGASSHECNLSEMPETPISTSNENPHKLKRKRGITKPKINVVEARRSLHNLVQGENCHEPNLSEIPETPISTSNENPHKPKKMRGKNKMRTALLEDRRSLHDLVQGESSYELNLSEIPETPISTSDENPHKPKKKRGITEMTTSVMEATSRSIVKVNNLGQPIGDESVRLSSFLGPLVREIVPVTLADWRKLSEGMKETLWNLIKTRYEVDDLSKKSLFNQMGSLWGSSKSRLIAKIREARDEEELLQLKPDNIESIHEWKDFVKAKTSIEFEAKSERFRQMRKKQIPHTCSRKGFARLLDEMKKSSEDPDSVSRVDVWIKAHVKKNGEPVNSAAAETISKLKQLGEDPALIPVRDIREDAISKVLGPERNGRLRGLGNRATLTKIAILAQKDENMRKIQEEYKELKDDLKQLRCLVSDLMKNQVRSGEEQSNSNLHSPLSVNDDLQPTTCKLLDWLGSGEIVAEGRWSSSDPNALVHNIPIGVDAMRVWVDVVKKPGTFLWRSMTNIEEALRTTVAWPAKMVIMGSTT